MRMSLKLAACAVLLTAGAVTPVSAHHSAEAAYDINKTVTFEGTLQRIDWINPHVLFHVVQTGPGARTTAWTVEANPPRGPGQEGFRRRDRQEGDGRGLAGPQRAQDRLFPGTELP